MPDSGKTMSDLERKKYLAMPEINPLETDSLGDLRNKYWSYLQNPNNSVSDDEYANHLAAVTSYRGKSMEDLRRARRYIRLGTPDADTAETNTDLAYRILESESTHQNLLTANQASVETDLTGLYGTSGYSTIERIAEAKHGSYCVAVKATSTIYSSLALSLDAGITGIGGQPVEENVEYTVQVSVKAPIITYGIAVHIRWWNEADALVGNPAVSATIPLTQDWEIVSSSGIAPLGAVRMSIQVYINGPSAVNDVFHVDCLGLWVGEGGDWQMP